MIYRKTKDYDSFRCIAGDCPESCCIGWQIMIDEESLARYREMANNRIGQNDTNLNEKENSELAKLLADGIDWEEACFCQQDGRCSMLREDNLCKLQAACGEEILCNTCHCYPRHMEEYEGEREYSLSVSCPECARILLAGEEPMRFLEWEDETEEEYDEFDYMLYSGLCESREKLYAIAQNRKLPIGLRLEKLLQAGRMLQNALDEGEYSFLQEWDGEVDSETANDVMLTDAAVRNAFSKLYELENLNARWPRILENTWTQGVSGELEASLTEAIWLEQLLMFFLYTYYLGAVYDEMIYSKVALSVYSVVFIYWVYMAHRRSKDDLETMIWATYRYAREIEHSDENLNALEDYYDGTMPR